MTFINTIILKRLFIRREKLFIFLIVFFLGGLFFTFLGQMYYNAKINMFSGKAENAFRNALQQKLQEESFEGYIFNSERKQSVGLQDTIYIIDAEGRHAYPLDKEKNSKNITSDTHLRVLHSTYLSNHPIALDSLYVKWHNFLMEENLYGTYMLQFLISDIEGNIKTSVFPKISLNEKFVQCFNCTVGYRCEVDIYGFYRPVFREIIGLEGVVYSLCYWLSIIGIYGIVLYLMRKSKEIADLKKREDKLMEQHIKNVESTDLHNYRLYENVIFYFEQRKLIIDDEEISMNPQTAILLQNFLDAPNHTLKDKEIENLFWTDKSYNADRLYNAIGRLRKVLEKIPNIEIQRIEFPGYQLQFKTK